MFPDEDELDLGNEDELDEDKEATEADDDFKVPEDEGEEFVVPQMSRKEKKRNRYKEQIERADSAEQERDGLRREIDQLKARPPQAPPTAPRPAEDPYKDKLAQVQQRRRDLFASYNAAASAAGDAGLSKTDQDDWLSRSSAIDDEVADLRIERKLVARDQHDAGNETKRQIRSRHMDVAGNAEAWNEAEAIYRRVTKHEGKPDHMDTLDEVMDEVRVKYRMGKSRHGGQQVTDRDRGKYAGVPRGGKKPAPEKAGYKMTELDREMADTAFPDMKPQDRYRHYAEGLKNKE